MSKGNPGVFAGAPQEEQIVEPPVIYGIVPAHEMVEATSENGVG